MIRAALEEVKHAIPDESLARLVRDANNLLTTLLGDALDIVVAESDDEQGRNGTNSLYSDEDVSVQPAVSDKVEVNWPLDGTTVALLPRYLMVYTP